ncbi:MAG: endonuclease [Aeromicrobium sp.]|nr:endonuclease [Aeromicrobium sp.]
MLDYRDAEYARTASLESGLRMRLERGAVALAIGEATGLSEGQVVYKLAPADRVRSKAPAVWVGGRGSSLAAQF